MTDADRTLGRRTVERAVETIDADWTVRSIEPVTTGTAAVAQVTVETAAGPRACALKASPDGDAHGIDTEGRVLSLLWEHTPVPVPEPLGVVDDHPDLPTPLLVTAWLPGESIPRTDLDRLDAATAERVARSMGRHLATVHDVDAVDAFGLLEPAERDLSGERPPSDTDAVRVVDGETDWQTAMRDFADRELEALSKGRFADRVPTVERALHDRIDRLSGPFEPVLGHVDGLLENVRVDVDTGEVIGLLDWGFTLAATPGYDLVHVASGVGGGLWTAAEPVEWADRAREALVAGYGERAPDRVAAYRRNRDCYELLLWTRAGAHIEEWLGLQDFGPERIAAVEQSWDEGMERLLAED